MRKNTINNQFMDFSRVGKRLAEAKDAPDPKTETRKAQDNDPDAGAKESNDV